MMTATEITTDAAGYVQTTYTDGADYYLGQPVATVMQTSAGWDTILGWYERNGWNGSLEFVVTHHTFKPAKTLGGALRRVRDHLAIYSKAAA
jgi:hypothetical protein